PAVEPLASTSRALDRGFVGHTQYAVATHVQRTLQRYRESLGIIALLGMDELSDGDNQTVNRARRVQFFLSQSVHVAEVFTGMPGSYVTIEDTVNDFGEILEGKYDDVPEDAFRLVGGIDDVIEKAKN